MHENEADTQVAVLSRIELSRFPAWSSAFASERKDFRYFEIVEDTIEPKFDHRYFAIIDGSGQARAFAPFFIVDQDILQGAGSHITRVVEAVRKIWPRFLRMRTLMIGCAAGEGHFDSGDDAHVLLQAEALASGIEAHARALKVSLIVLKEFPAKYRDILKCFQRRDFTRVPSLPMTKLNIDYASFDDYMKRALNSATRTKLRKKFRIASEAPPITMSVVPDISSDVDAIYPLYMQVYERSKLHFEKLTPEYFCRIGKEMTDKVRFFVWRQNGKIIAFAMCMINGEEFFAEYVGFDYTVALELHLYHYVVRDMITWAIQHGYKTFRSSALNYDPKLHLRHRLDPIDLYVKHTSGAANRILKWVLPILEPTRNDKTLQMFPNYAELWGNTPVVAADVK